MATKKTATTKNMTLLDLQGILGDRVRVTLDPSLTAEEREIENEQSYLVANLAKQMINNGDLILRIEKLMAQTKGLNEFVSHGLIK